MAITNTQIIENYKAINAINQPLHTYNKWQSLGYQVKKGEHSQHKITVWKPCTKKTKVQNDDGTISIVKTSKLILTPAAFFLMSQVEAIAN